MAEYDASAVMGEYLQLRKIRTPYEEAWRELSFLTSPRRNRWYLKKDVPNNEFYDRFSDTGVLALREMADGVLGSVFNPAHMWYQSVRQDTYLSAAGFTLKVRAVDTRNQLEGLDQHVAQAMRRGKFYAAGREFLLDLYGIGNGITMFWNNDDTGAPAYKTEHMKNVWFREDDSKEINCVYRRVVLDPKDVLDVFERAGDVISPKLRDELKKYAAVAGPLTQEQFNTLDGTQNEVVFIHCICFDEDSEQWRSMYVWEGEPESFVRDTYYAYKPFAAARCYTNSDEVYGYAPGHDVLGSLLTANQMGKTLLKAGQIAVDPILAMDASFRDGIDLTPGAVNYTTNPDAIAREIYKIGQYPIAKDQAERIDKMILQAYFSDYFRRLSAMTQRMTAVQVMALEGEKAPLLSGLTNSLETDYLVPILRGTLEIELAAGRIPQGLKDSFGKQSIEDLYRTSTVRFTGTLPQLAANFQEFGDLQKYLTVQQAMIEVYQDPSIGDWTKKDVLAKVAHRSANMPQSMLATDDEVSQIRTQRAQQQAKQQQNALAAQTMAGIRDAGKVPDPGSPGEDAMTYLSKGAG